MDSETAIRVAQQGSTLLLLEVPEHTVIGIDTQVVSVGPAFKGIKMIPPGPHFLYYCSSTRDGKDFSPVTGYFVDSGTSEVIVRQWDPQEERLIKLPQEEEERYCLAVRNWEFDKHLGPYDLTQYGDWKRLSNYITKTTIQRIEPIGGEITVASEPALLNHTPKSAMEKALDDQLKLKASHLSTTPSDTSSSARRCYYTSIPHVIKHRGMDGQKLTSLNLDKTQLLESLLLKDYGGSEDMLLGELQFSFVAFLMGQSLEAFLQWKSLISLLFGCTEAPFQTRSRLFVKFIEVIYYQLKHALKKDCTNTSGVSTLFDDSWFTADSFLHHLFKEFFLLVQDASVVDGDLLSWMRKLKALLESSFGWEFQQNSAVEGMYFEEDDEFAPVVVMLDDPSSTEA